VSESAYRTVVVGTDGSASSLRAVARAGALAGACGATLLDVVHEESADLLVVGNGGLARIKGRLLGSVPADATRRSTVDVPVVHTTG
jgi:nucleotide-binding universal stress UspA family protein